MIWRKLKLGLATALIVACALTPLDTRAQTNSPAAQLFVRTQDMGSVTEATLPALRRQLVTEARRELARTSRSNEVEWGTLQVVLSLNLLGEDNPGALAAARAALRVLTAENAPYPWAFAQQQRMILVSGSMATDDNADWSAISAEIDAAQKAALSVFTIEAYPYEHLNVRCVHGFLKSTASINAQSQIMSAPLLSACYPYRNSMFGQMRQTFLTTSLSAMIQNGNQPRYGPTVAELGRWRALGLAAMLDMDQLGLAPDKLQRARALRAQADMIVARSPSVNDPMFRTNKEFWRANAELYSILRDTRPTAPPATRIEDTIIAPLILDQSQGLISIMRYDGAAGVSVIPGSDAQTMLAQVSSNQIGSGVAAWTRDYRAGDTPRAIAAFRQRFEPAWGIGLHDAARRGGLAPGGRLLILSDGLSSGLPLGLLRDPRTGRSLIEDYEVIYTPSLSAYQAARRRSHAFRPPSLISVSVAEANLPFAEAQNSIAANAFGANVLRPSSAAKADLLSALPNASYWQFSTHGDFNFRQPRLSGLMLANRERLTLSDLYFAEKPLGAPNLVILSACETALFDTENAPDEFIGLPAGFLQAGATGVIGSLWPVPDVSTALLMARFYDLHLRGQQRPSMALRNAQLWLKSITRAELNRYVEQLEANGSLSTKQADDFYGAIVESAGVQPFSDPYHWGAWVYFGA